MLLTGTNLKKIKDSDKTNDRIRHQNFQLVINKFRLRCSVTYKNCYQLFVTKITVACRFMFENVHDHQCIFSVIKLNFEYFQAGK